MAERKYTAAELKYGSHIIIDPKLAQALREFAFEKHKTGYRSVKIEAELAISNHIKAGRRANG